MFFFLLLKNFLHFDGCKRYKIMSVPVGRGYVSLGFLPVCRLTGISYGFIQ